MSQSLGVEASKMSSPPKMADEVVEIGLFLPVRRAEALIALSRKRCQSVGQIIRGLIDQALLTAEA